MAQMTIKELEDTLLAAQSQLAKVDKEYVNYSHKGHLFDYNINYVQFLEDIAFIIKEGYKRQEQRKGTYRG